MTLAEHLDRDQADRQSGPQDGRRDGVQGGRRDGGRTVSVVSGLGWPEMPLLRRDGLLGWPDDVRASRSAAQPPAGDPLALSGTASTAAGADAAASGAAGAGPAASSVDVFCPAASGSGETQEVPARVVARETRRAPAGVVPRETGRG